MISLEEDGRALSEVERNALRTLVVNKGLATATDELAISSSVLTRALAVLPIARESVERLRAALQKKGYLPCPPTP